MVISEDSMLGSYQQGCVKARLLYATRGRFKLSQPSPLQLVLKSTLWKSGVWQMWVSFLYPENRKVAAAPGRRADHGPQSGLGKMIDAFLQKENEAAIDCWILSKILFLGWGKGRDMVWPELPDENFQEWNVYFVFSDKVRANKVVLCHKSLSRRWGLLVSVWSISLIFLTLPLKIYLIVHSAKKRKMQLLYAHCQKCCRFWRV